LALLLPPAYQVTKVAWPLHWWTSAASARQGLLLAATCNHDGVGRYWQVELDEKDDKNDSWRLVLRWRTRSTDLCVADVNVTGVTDLDAGSTALLLAGQRK